MAQNTNMDVSKLRSAREQIHRLGIQQQSSKQPLAKGEKNKHPK